MASRFGERTLLVASQMEHRQASPSWPESMPSGQNTGSRQWGRGDAVLRLEGMILLAGFQVRGSCLLERRVLALKSVRLLL